MPAPRYKRRSAMALGLIRTMRPHQWVKNLFVVAPLVFAQELLNVHAALRSLAGFAVFSIVASAVYVLNDLSDVEADRNHPTKRLRPIASGAVSVPAARLLLAGLLALGGLGGMTLGPPFLGIIAAYFAKDIAYSFGLKKIAYLDVLFIALGFELRVLAGAFAAEVPASGYLLVVTFLFATFLGLGKRLHELGHAGDGTATRSALRAYDPRIVTGAMAVSGVLTLITYATYTVDPHTIEAFGTANLWVTTLNALFGFARFIFLVRRRDNAESPTDAMLRDWPFLLNLAAWAVEIVVLLYVG